MSLQVHSIYQNYFHAYSTSSIETQGHIIQITHYLSKDAATAYNFIELLITLIIIIKKYINANVSNFRVINLELS